jgi:hypothetical protein
MKNREEKRDKTIEHLKQAIDAKKPSQVSASEGSFLLLERIENILLDMQQGEKADKTAGTTLSATVPAPAKKRFRLFG